LLRSEGDHSGAKLNAAEGEALAKALELELIAKRASWQRARARRGTWLTMSLLFLFLVFAGAVAAWFFFATEIRERREKPTPVRAEHGR